MEIFIKCSLNIIPRLFFLFMCCSSSLFFHGGIAAKENKTDPIEVEALDAIFRKWKQIDGGKTWNINSTNPCIDYVVNDSNNETIDEFSFSSYGKVLEISCSCDNTTSICNIIGLSAWDLKLLGTIPNELENLTKLVYMNLRDNSLTGELPDFLWTLTEMETMTLSGNDFDGSLSPEIRNMKNIKKLDLSYNNFSGPLPSEIGNLENIQTLNLSDNHFSGPLPSEIGNLENIQTMILYNNDFDGSIPLEIENLRNMQKLDLYYNNFGGKVPDTFWNLTNLIYLEFSHNSFEGTIPTNIGNFVNLNVLDLSYNNFGGKVPDTLWNLTNLMYLHLSYNSFEGTILTNIGNFVNIIFLHLSNNNFSGELPSQIGNLKNIKYLFLSNNKFGGKIPKNLWNLKSLEYLYLRNCSLEDFLPDERIEIPLRTLDLGFNDLAGKLPNTIFNIPTLESLYLNNNDLNDGLPDKMSDSLKIIDLSNNNLEGYIDPKWNGVALNLINNKFKLEDFKDVSNLKGLECLQQTSNCFKGEKLFTSFAINCGGEEMESADGKTIFESDNNDKTNTYFYVADKNKWAVTFSERFDLINSKKDITYAQDPKLYQSASTSAKTLKYYGLGLEVGNYTVDLMFANIDDDDDDTYKYIFDIYIQGILEEEDCEILKEPAFKKTYKVLVTNDTKNLEISFNPKIYSKGSSAVLISAIKVTSIENGSTKRSATVIGVSVGVSVFILSCIVGYYLWKRHMKYYYSIDEGNIELNGLEVNTYRFLELNTATENFKPSNKLGKGGFGVVYKGTLYNGDIVAVKKLLVESIQGNEQFIAEVTTISEVRQRNLVKLHGCCCHGNKRMLVYEYMENGSLDTALYGRTSQLELDWDIRFTICLGIAKGLNYLHQYSTHRIIHRDIKSSNILLDQYLNPKISDFGLAKLFEDKMTHISTRAAGTYGYLAPEYALSGHLTEKVDVFAFGVVALEIISGKCCVDYSFVSFGSNQAYIIQWAWNIHENMDDDLAMVDPKLKSFNKEEVCRIIQVALLCTQMDSMSRPSMSHVIAMLNGEKDIGTLPSKPSYLMFWDVGDSSRGVDDIEFQPDQFDSRQQISSCSYFQSMPLQHAHTGSSKQKDEDYTKTF